QTFTGNITKQSVTITAVDREKCFNTTFTNGQDANPTHFTTAGFIGGQGITSVNLAVPQPGGVGNQVTGTFTLTPSAAVADVNTNLNNYNVTYVPGTLTAQLEIRAFISGAANLDICDGSGVSLNYTT